MYNVYRFYIFSIVFLIVISLVSVYSSSYNYVVDRKIFMSGSIDVVYRASLEKPRVLVKIYNVDYNDPVVLSMFIWMPNGSVVEVGKTFFKGSYGEIDYRYLANVYDEWNNHLKKIGARPGSIDIGLIILGTIHKRDGVYTLATSIPLNPEYISKRLGIDITINKKLIKTLDIEEFKKINISKRSDEIKFSEKESLIPIAHAQTTTWPPGEIYTGTCYYGTCLIWEAVEQKISYNTVVPLVAAAIRNSWDRVYAVYLYKHLVAGSRSGVKIVFGIGAAVDTRYEGVSPGVKFEILGYDWVANDETAANLDYGKFFVPGIEFNSQSILHIGFKADIAYVKYQLKKCNYDIVPYCEYYNIYMNTTMTRPANGGPLTNDKAVYGVVSIYNYNDPVVQVYNDLAERGWFSGQYKYSFGEFSVTTSLMKSEQNTLSQLTLFINVIKILIALGLLFSAPVYGSLILPLIASVGVEPYSTSYNEDFGIVAVRLISNYSDWAYYQYAKSPVKYEFNNGNYTVTMLFVDLWVDATANPHERSYS